MSSAERPRIGTLGVDPIVVHDVTSEFPVTFSAELPLSPHVDDGPVLIERSAYGLLSLSQASGSFRNLDYEEDIILIAVEDIPALIALLQQALEAT